ncbi:MAG: hypothetical protein M0O96_00240 [Desulforhopalus sp.]|nr:hypothetical protein [Desulforhopalus sp.]
MDLVDLIAEKRWLGQEFLTWLWFKSDERGGSIALPDRGDISVVFEKHMSLESGEGESLERITCSGQQSELREARTGLAMGKKLESARLSFGFNDYEFSVTLSGSLMEYRSVALPRTEGTEVDGSNPEEVEGMVLERIFLLEELTKTVNQCFRMFLDIRLGDEWRDELIKIREWVEKNAEVVTFD